MIVRIKFSLTQSIAVDITSRDAPYFINLILGSRVLNEEITTRTINMTEDKVEVSIMEESEYKEIKQ